MMTEEMNKGKREESREGGREREREYAVNINIFVIPFYLLVI